MWHHKQLIEEVKDLDAAAKLEQARAVKSAAASSVAAQQSRGGAEVEIVL